MKFWIYWTLRFLSNLWFYGITWNFSFSLDVSPLFLQTREEISEKFEQLVKLVDFVEYSRYFQDLPKPRSPSHTNSETKKVWTLLQPKPSQVRGVAWGAAQARCSSAALPSDYITTPVALVQHCSGRGAAQRSSRYAAAAGRLRSISLVCVLHNTITLLLTAVKVLSKSPVKLDTSPQ